ncbi:sulfite exporter TauE/SafE family protein [Haloferula sp. BvORR071]|uniref:sulfite exporter TauE/SafE family protein n=1 Tax=Haloferula sp. BvORR071 TaxID=1396141 RepID=UPI0005529C93|nr:sulfite exporter TauE/SafE family protein [Haloferula sp. BvORR071]
MPSQHEWIVLAAGFLAAVMNAVAGGGTMLTFPALMAAGLSPVMANTTSTVALFIGMPGSVWAFRKHLAEMKPWILPLGIASVLGGLGGGVLLLALDPKVFKAVVPWLLLMATALFLLNAPIQRRLKRMRGEHAGESEPERPQPWGVAFQTGVAVYGGYFGAGIGIMMLAGLSLLGLKDLNRINALKSLLALLCNIASVIWFISKDSVDWHLAGWLVLGSLPGYFLGAHFAQRIPATAVRVIVAVIGFGIAINLFWKQFQ